MTDLALIWNEELGAGDLAIEAGDLKTDAGLRTAVLVSLFTNRRAQPDDVLPADDGDRGGWWGDVSPQTANDLIGSRLWLLAREKRLASVLVRARDYCIEALAWLLADGVAAAVDVEVEAQGAALAIGVTITRPDGGRSRFDTAWSAT